jgi:hypothetical protein
MKFVENELLSVVKIQNDGCIKDGVGSDFYSSPTIFKTDYLSIFIFYLKNKKRLSWKKIFLNSKWQNN